MALKNVYEINNISVGDSSKTDKYLITPPEGYVEFPSKFTYIPASMRGFKLVVIGPKTVEVGNSVLDDIDTDSEDEP
jgi:hypothetical protein